MKYILSLLVVIFTAFSVSGQNEKPDRTSPANAGMVSITGENFGQAELSGKVVVLNFWYIGCPPCLKEMPELNELVREYKGKDVVFLGLAVDGKQKIEAFLREKPFNYEIIPSAAPLMMRFLVPDENGKLETKFPTHIVVSREGKRLVYETGIKGIEAVKAELKRQFRETEKPEPASGAAKTN